MRSSEHSRDVVKGVQRVRAKKKKKEKKERMRNDLIFIWVEPDVRPSLQAINKTRGWQRVEGGSFPLF